MRKFLILAALVLAACGSDSTGPKTVNVVGVYQLQTVNGNALPYSETSGGTTTSITADQLSLNADETFSEITDYRVTDGVTTVTTQGAGIGVYTSANGAVSFTQTSPNASTFSGSVSGNQLTIIEAGATFVFRR